MLIEKVYLLALARLGLSSIAVAHELGVHHSTLSRWVRNWYPVPIAFRGRLAEILELNTQELFEGVPS
ncbi:MAG: helix-turn-helix transcriptional regulator [Deltaproteobacteria bacterium]|nr:helix-turn-helix transcriptional regulator [Deltaproteobacteria bacterium]